MTDCTLDEFLAASPSSGSRGHLKEPGFETLYVRYTRRWISAENAWVWPCLDIASVSATTPGQGAFTALINRIRKEYPKLHIYVESILNKRFIKTLHKLGFVPADGEPCTCTCMYWSPDTDKRGGYHCDHEGSRVAGAAICAVCHEPLPLPLTKE